MELLAIVFILIVVIAVIGKAFSPRPRQSKRVVPRGKLATEAITPPHVGQAEEVASAEALAPFEPKQAEATTPTEIEPADKVITAEADKAQSAAPELRIAGSQWLPERFVVLDLETTGLSPELDEILEIGAIRIITGKTTQATFSALVKPEQRIPRRIAQMTGITQGMVNESGVPVSKALPWFIEFIGDLPLVTFNADFDMGFLWNAAKRQGLTIENQYACALKLSRRAWPQLPSHRLADLAEIAKLSDDDTHRALGDCKRAVVIFAEAVSAAGEEICWSYRKRDWREYQTYYAARDPNRTFVTETRPFEVSDPAQAVIRYNEAIGRMYEYEKLIGSRTGDDLILDRLTLCLWRLRRYQELIDCVECFKGRFPDAKSSLMTAILKRKEEAACKVAG